MRNTLFVPVVLLLALVLLVAPVSAQETAAPDTPATGDYPTLDAINAATIPPADPVSLARRFRGVTDVAPPPATAPAYQIGQRRTFWASELGADRMFEVEAELRVTGEHIHFWVETGTPVDTDGLRLLADVFDTEIYEQVRDLWGSEATPGIDGDPRVHALLARNLGFGVAAYYAGRHSFPQEVIPTSNEAEMFFVNLSALPDVRNPFLYNTLAHEFQHMIRANVDPDEEAWMDEGYSTFTELILGLSSANGTALAYMDAPGTQLNTWNFGSGPSAPHYGASMLFITYFYEQFGPEALRLLSADTRNGLASVAHVLAQIGGPDVNTFFADWVLANALHPFYEGDAPYNYKLLDGALVAPDTGVIMSLPARIQGRLNQYAAAYYRVPVLPDTSSLAITLDTPDTVQLVPTDAASGRFMWYSNRGDGSNPTLTRAFDLSGVDSATLRFKTWYDIEYGWDYAYVSASTDGGATWTILPATTTTDFDPHGNSYGTGFTGESGGWIDVEASLDAFTGGEVLLRFEMVTDEAVNHPGMVIDDIAIPAIDYAYDVESGDDGWISNGWLRIDNVLPQNIWVQAVQMVDGEAVIDRWMAPSDAPRTLDIRPGVESVTLALSPFAPITTIPATYTLDIRQ